jgi:hypothetical protein
MAPKREIRWSVPPGWKQFKGSNVMRRAEFDVGLAKQPHGAPPPRCVVFQGIQGTNEENIARWAAQFSQTDGSDTRKDHTQVTTAADKGVTVTRVEMSGSFSTAMVPGSGGEATRQAVMLGGIVEGKKERIFIKLVGTKEQIELARPGFEALLGSMRATK